MMAPELRRAYDIIRKHDPARLRFVSDDGGKAETVVPPADTSKRWQNTMRMVEHLPWVRIECLDATNQLLTVVTRETVGPARAAAPAAAAPAAAAPVGLGVNDIITAQRLVLDAHLSGTKQMTQVVLELVKVIALRQEAANASMQRLTMALERQAIRHSRQVAEAGPAPGDESDGLMEMAAPFLLSLMGGGDAGAADAAPAGEDAA